MVVAVWVTFCCGVMKGLGPLRRFWARSARQGAFVLWLQHAKQYRLRGAMSLTCLTWHGQQLFFFVHSLTPWFGGCSMNGSMQTRHAVGRRSAEGPTSCTNSMTDHETYAEEADDTDKVPLLRAMVPTLFAVWPLAQQYHRKAVATLCLRHHPSHTRRKSFCWRWWMARGPSSSAACSRSTC